MVWVMEEPLLPEDHRELGVWGNTCIGGEHITAVCAFLLGILLSPGADPRFVRLKLV